MRVLLIVALLPLPVLAQSVCKVMDGYATASLPATCTNGWLAYDETTEQIKECTSNAWSTLSGAVSNASQLLGATWAAPGTIGSGTPNTGAFTTLSASGVITSTQATGTAPFTVASTTPISNLAVIQGGLEGDVAAGLDERFEAPLTGYETSTFPPSTVTLTNTTSFTWTAPGAGFPSDTAFIRQAAALTGHGAGANVVAHRGLGYAVNGNRGVDSTNSAMRLSAVFVRGGYFSAWYRAGTESCCDFARLYVDGGLVVTANGSDTGWVNYTSAYLAPGTHTMDFRFTKDSSVHSNGDMLMIDDVTIKDGRESFQTCTSAASTTCTITVVRSGCTPLCGPGATAAGTNALKSAVVSGTTLTCTFLVSGTNNCNCWCP